MTQYILQPDEVVLFENENANMDRKPFHVIVTNMNIVFIRKKMKRLQWVDADEVYVHTVASVKMYDGKPQIKAKYAALSVTVYFDTEVVSFMLPDVVAVKKFENAVYNVLCGTTMSVRGASKVKSAIGVVDDTLGISVVDTAKEIIASGVSGKVLGTVQRAIPVKASLNIGGILSKRAEAKADDKNESETPDKKETSEKMKEQIELLKKWKELLDAGIIDEEEFSEKKKEILNK